MDPDITGSSNKNINNALQKSNGCDLNADDFFTELFPEYKLVNNSFQGNGNSANTHLASGSISDSYNFDIPVKYGENMMNGHDANETSIKSEKLNLMNKELKEKIINQESQIAQYEDKLSKNMEDLLTTKTCMENLKNNCENLQKENLALKEEVKHFQARIHQLEELKLQKIGEDNEITNLQKDLSVKEKLQRKLKNDLGNSTQKLTETCNHLRKVKCTNKRLWTLITEFGNTLSKAGLLTSKHKKILLKDHADDFSASDVESEGESSKDVNSFFNEMVAATEDKPCNSSGMKMISDSFSVHSTASPPLQAEGFLGVNNDKSLSRAALKITPNEINYPEVSKVSDNCGSAFLPRSDSSSNLHDGQTISSTTVKSSINTSSSAKVKSFGSNYFLKSCKDVLDDPHLTDYHIDATCKELQDLRRQFPNEHFSPISPLPRTPSPRNLKSKLHPNNKAQLLRPSGKRLNFRHQQSESFDVHELQPPENSDCLFRNPIDNICEMPSPRPDHHTYTLSTKRNLDGSLKFNFSANVNTNLCLDMNTLQVSCIVMPQRDSHIDISHSNQHCIPSSVSSHGAHSSNAQPQLYSPLQSSHTLISNDISENIKQNIVTSLSNKHINSSQMSVCELKNPMLNNAETDKNPKKIKLDIINPHNENHVSNQENSELHTSVNVNTLKKNNELFPDEQVQCSKEKIEFLSSNNNSNENVNFDNSQSAFSLPPAVPEIKRVSSNDVTQSIPTSIINFNMSHDKKKIKRSKSIGKVNNQNNVLDNNKIQKVTDELLIEPTASELQYATSSPPEENITHEKKCKKKARNVFKKRDKEILSNQVMETEITEDNDVKKGKRIKSKLTLSENINQHGETNPTSDNHSPNSSIIWKNKNISIFKVPRESKCTVSTNENLSEANKLKSLLSDKISSKVEVSILSNSHNSPDSNSSLSVNKEFPSNADDSALKIDNLLLNVNKTCSVTCLPSPSKKEVVDVLMPFSPDKSTYLGKAEDIKFVNNTVKNDINSNKSEGKESLKKKQCNSLIKTPEGKENKLLCNEMNYVDFSKLPSLGMFTPKGLFTNIVDSDDAKKNISIVQESSVNVPKLPPKSSPSKSSVKAPKSSKKELSASMNNCSSNHNGFLSDVNHTCDEKNDECTVGAPEGNKETIHANEPLTSINSETGESSLEISGNNNHETNTKTKVLKNSFDLGDMDSDDLHSEHTLVIAENLDNAESSKVESDVDNSESSLKRIVHKRSPKKKKKKKKGFNLGNQKKLTSGKLSQKRKISNSVNPSQLSIAAAFNALDQVKFTDMHFKLTQHTLINALINPNNASCTRDVVYHILKYLSVSKSNPFLNYHIGSDETALLPLTEKCIVSVLVAISKKKKQRLQGILESTINTIYQVVLTKDKFSIYGLSSLCRVITELCKYKNDREKLLMLCCDLLKIQHKYAPYLIASIASVWKELFDVHTASVKERIFHSSVAYGVHKKPQTLTDQQWIHCSKILSSYLSATPFTDIKETVTSVMDLIQVTFRDGVLDEEYIVTTPIVTIAAVEGWEWAKENLIDEHIIPLMVAYAEREHNLQAFKVFCNLYVDICNFCPDLEEPNEVLVNFFFGNKGEESIRNEVAKAQMKLILLKKLQLLPPHLTDWVNQNQSNAEIADFAQKLFQRRLMMDENDLLESEIM